MCFPKLSFALHLSIPSCISSSASFVLLLNHGLEVISISISISNITISPSFPTSQPPTATMQRTILLATLLSLSSAQSIPASLTSQIAELESSLPGLISAEAPEISSEFSAFIASYAPTARVSDIPALLSSAEPAIASEIGGAGLPKNLAGYISSAIPEVEGAIDSLVASLPQTMSLKELPGLLVSELPALETEAVQALSGLVKGSGYTVASATGSHGSAKSTGYGSGNGTAAATGSSGLSTSAKATASASSSASGSGASASGTGAAAPTGAASALGWSVSAGVVAGLVGLMALL